MYTFPISYLLWNSKGDNLLISLAKKNQIKHIGSLINKKMKQSIVHGYAWGGHEKQVTNLISGDSSLIYPAVVGYARGGKKIEVGKLIDKYSGKYKELKKYAAFGYALRLDTKVIERAYHDLKHIESVIKALALTNQKLTLFQMIKGTLLYGEAIKEAARGGNRELVRLLFQKCGFDDKKRKDYELNRLMLLNKAIVGYARGGHFGFALEMVEKGGSLTLLVAEIDGFEISENITIDIALLLNEAKDDIQKKALLDQIIILNPKLTKRSILEQDISEFNINGKKSLPIIGELYEKYTNDGNQCTSFKVSY